MRSTREVATGVVSMLREDAGEARGCINLFDFKDCLRYTEIIATALDEALEEGGGVCS